ncbi:MAG: hypothetical protein K2Q01_08945 [Rickettsiales bacterium]|nr:hypothetical protein [Rickettsiales bacterium]
MGENAGKPVRKRKSDLARLRGITRLLIRKLEAAVKKPVEAKPEEDKQEGGGVAEHDRVFGAKASLTSTLVVLSDLFLKLEGASAGQAAAAEEGVAISDADAALVEAFVQRVRERV